MSNKNFWSLCLLAIIVCCAYFYYESRIRKLELAGIERKEITLIMIFNQNTTNTNIEKVEGNENVIGDNNKINKNV